MGLLTGQGILLLVVAHPDDEAMFFAPILQTFKQSDGQICLLCLSNGNAAGLGKRRELELKASCGVLQVDNCVIINDPELQDGMDVRWEPKVIADHITKQVETCGATLVVSFDAHGVSKHANHCAIYHGLLQYRLMMERLSRPVPAIWVLVTTGLLRKYAGLLDVPLSLLGTWGSPRWACCISLRPWLSIRAMLCHWSQLIWYRWLFILVSRYSYVNTLVQMA